ncbi:hypothetical protein AB0I28_17235 [Phytomonospora sp. NPDC050363]|uniref:hypothetical protein n=1 Tax=Phytomonospora sp. NPDC050363 TaxID=3155642 RepID=UPI0033EA6B2F
MPDKSSLISIELEHMPDPQGRAPNPIPPRLIREVLDTLNITDGSIRLTAEPQSIQRDDVSTAIDMIIDPDRQLPVVIAAESFTVDDRWERLIKDVAKLTLGTAVVCRVSTDALDELNTAIGEPHRIGPGAIRTFLPDVELGSPADARRHRVLSYRRLQDPQFNRADLRIARLPRLSAIHTPLPEVLADTVFRRGNTAVLDDLQSRRSAVTSADGQGSEALAENLRQTTEALDRALLALAESNDSRDLAELARRALEQEVLERTSQWEAEVVDHDETQTELSTARRWLADLQRRLTEVGHHEGVYSPPEGGLPPKSFDELNERAPAELEGLRLTYDLGKALELDEDLKSSTWAAKAWDALNSLASYSCYRRDPGFSGTFRDFCEAAPQGMRVYPITQIAMTESDTVRNDPRMAKERVLQVPIEVEPSGSLFMPAHIKLGSKGGLSPRIYFYDDTAGATSTVIIGYLGRHLTNTRS